MPSFHLANQMIYYYY
uniref:Uncharacterized protein n=1 Tax=Rhizophora mucronata TaxID=61149 RepID=A0A2P2P832_RHIMU